MQHLIPAERVSKSRSDWKPRGRRSHYLCAFALLSLMLHRLDAQEQRKTIAPQGMVVDLEQKPIQGAEISLHRWTGVMSPALDSAATDANGNFQFSTYADDGYYCVMIRKASYAPMHQTFYSNNPLTVTLRNAVKGWIEVRSAAGEPLKDAMITMIVVRTPENRESIIDPTTISGLGLKLTPSNENGQLTLPLLPAGSIVDICVSHPRWAQVHVNNLNVVEERLGQAVMPPGIMTTFDFVADPRAPISLDDMMCVVYLQASKPTETLNRVPMTISKDRFTFCAHPGKYSRLTISTPRVVITPELNRLKIGSNSDSTYHFLVRNTANVSGRIVHRGGSPHAGVEVRGWTQNLLPDGTTPPDEEWISCSLTKADGDGNFELAMPAGPGRIRVYANGYSTEAGETNISVSFPGPNLVPEILTEPLGAISGMVVDENGTAVSGAYIRVRHPALRSHPVVSDDKGQFSFEMKSLPDDLVSKKQAEKLDLAAFIIDKPLAGVVCIDPRRREERQNVRIVLKPETSADTLLKMADNEWGTKLMQDAIDAGTLERYEEGERGHLAPELDAIEWLNTNVRSLKELRGRYVLLDFWFVGCGPCHADLPSVKLVHEQFKKMGVTVVAVHNNSSTPEVVREYSQQIGLPFPIAVDHPDGRIVNAYRPIGLEFYPTYILIGPDGKILENDRTVVGPKLRSFKVELIRKYLLGLQAK